MTNMLRRRQPSGANGSPNMGPIPQAQDPSLKRFSLRLQTMSLYDTTVSITWVVAFIVLIRALAGVGYDGN